MSFLFPIFRLAWHHARRRPLQSFFFVLGVALGVAMIVAIDLANGSAQRAFELGAETVAGKATHQIVAGPGGVEETVYTQLRRQLGFRNSAPVVEGYVIARELDAQPLRLLGIDPFAEQPFRSYLGLGNQSQQPAPDFLGDLMARPNTILLSTALAERYGLKTGSLLTLRTGVRTQQVIIVGLLQPSDDLSRRALDGLLLTDISSAQEILGMVGKLSRIDLLLPEGEAREDEIKRLKAFLSPALQIMEASARSNTVGEMIAAFRLNLTALSLLALVVGLFLIYNTVTFSVVQRRPVLGSLRALGMTQREIFGLILLEAGLLGMIGTLLGLGLGVLLGRGAVQLVTQTINDLFFVVSVRQVNVPVFTLVKGATIGILAALIGAALPAWEATSVPPAGALKRSNVEERARALLPWLTALALVLAGIGALLLLPETNLIISFGGLFCVILGAALLTPLLTFAVMRAIERLLTGTSDLGARAEKRRADVIARMAPRSVLRSLSRTSVAIAALMVAVSVIIGVGVMIGSFRNTVEAWLNDVLQADIFITPATLLGNDDNISLTPELAQELVQQPGIRAAATTRSVRVAAWLANDQQIDLRLAALSQDLAGEQRRYRAKVGSNVETWQALEQGAILINEPMANRYRLSVGDRVTLQTDKGRREFEIAGVTVDFDVNNVAFIYDGVYRGLWNDTAITAVALFVEAGGDVDATAQQLRSAFANQAELLVRSNRGVRENALEVFDRTFAITVALQLLATLVAFIGILSTLMSLQLERGREIGVLRATGMTRRQLWRLSLLETGLLGATAGLIAMPVGLLLAVILIYIINLRSFGWSLELQLTPTHFGQAFLVALGAALLAGLYPAWRMGRIEPANALRQE
jgi:putative ABC transport system permease protein